MPAGALQTPVPPEENDDAAGGGHGNAAVGHVAPAVGPQPAGPQPPAQPQIPFDDAAQAINRLVSAAAKAEQFAARLEEAEARRTKPERVPEDDPLPESYPSVVGAQAPLPSVAVGLARVAATQEECCASCSSRYPAGSAQKPPSSSEQLALEQEKELAVTAMFGAGPPQNSLAELDGKLDGISRAHRPGFALRATRRIVGQMSMLAVTPACRRVGRHSL